MNDIINSYKESVIQNLKKIETENDSFNKDVLTHINNEETAYIKLLTEKNDTINELNNNIEELKDKYDLLTTEYKKLEEHSQQFEKVSILKNLNTQLHEKTLECDFLTKKLNKYKSQSIQMTIEETLEEVLEEEEEVVEEEEEETLEEEDEDVVEEKEETLEEEEEEEELEFIEKKLKCPKTKKFKKNRN